MTYLANRCVALYLLVCLIPSSSARAEEPQPEPSSEAAKAALEPWAVGVSDAQKDEAKRLLSQGNGEFLRGDHRAALASYQRGIAQWDHPALRFNAARALVMLDRPLEAYQNVELALRYPAALEEHVLAEAQGYERLLRGQVGEITVHCNQAGVKVDIDGHPLVRCPGTQRLRVLPGPHQVLGSGSGFLAQTRDVQVEPGVPVELTLELVPLVEATHFERRWPVWRPWAVVASGVVLGGGAALLRLSAVRNNDDYADDVAQLCADAPCAEGDLPRSTRDLATSARRQDRAAWAVGGLGVATAVAGLTLVLLNQPRAVLRTEPRPGSVALLPGPGAVGLGLGAAF